MKKEGLEKIRNYFKKKKLVKLVYVYGSQAKGKAKKDSDIDLAILVEEKKGKNTSSDIQLKAIIKLSQLLDKEVEVQNLNICKTTFAYRVISEGKVIYERDEEERVDFEMEVMRNYFDLKPLIDEFSQYLAERARNRLIAHRFYQVKQL